MGAARPSVRARAAGGDRCLLRARPRPIAPHTRCDVTLGAVLHSMLPPSVLCSAQRACLPPSNTHACRPPTRAGGRCCLKRRRLSSLRLPRLGIVWPWPAPLDAVCIGRSAAQRAARGGGGGGEVAVAADSPPCGICLCAGGTSTLFWPSEHQSCSLGFAQVLALSLRAAWDAIRAPGHRCIRAGPGGGRAVGGAHQPGRSRTGAALAGPQAPRVRRHLCG